mgnify:CR=1 FL=1
MEVRVFFRVLMEVHMKEKELKMGAANFTERSFIIGMPYFSQKHLHRIIATFLGEVWHSNFEMITQKIGKIHCFKLK